jgi:predicted O-methyltransferase YrrM
MAAATRFQIWLLRLSQLACLKNCKNLSPEQKLLITGMSSESAMRSTLRRVAGSAPPLLNAYRWARDRSRKDPVITALYRKFFDRGRLKLPVAAAEDFGPSAGSIELPVSYPLLAGEDAPLADLVFLLNLARGRQAKRILEVGTYRARTTCALHLNCPNAEVISYDIQVLESAYRERIQKAANVQLRHASFSASAAELRRERPFDLIFVDGSHYFEHVLEDSRLALELMAPAGIVVWHDYRPNDFYRNELRVPEALTILSASTQIFAVAETMCAVHARQISRGRQP